MNISGTLHFYSGNRKEFFFVFDDDVAQQLYENPIFDIENLNSRRVYVSVGNNRFIHRRTLSFSRKQTEIKVSLCSLGSKDGLGALTYLYDWFSARGEHPKPFAVLGKLETSNYQGNDVWELTITEPIDSIAPPGLSRRRKNKSRQRKSYETRRKFTERDLREIGRPAENLAFEIAQEDFPAPEYSCLYRRDFLDSERIEIRKLGIIADIDVWDEQDNSPHIFIEVKAQKVRRHGANSAFYLSLSEWHSYQKAQEQGLSYQIWLFQYLDLDDFTNAPNQIKLIVFDEINIEWLKPDGYLVIPESKSGKRFSIG
jgi:hypothetical protein